MDTQLFTEWVVATDMANEAIEFGVRKRWFFRLMEEKGAIEKPILKADFYYIPIEIDSVEIPQEALKRKEALEKEFCVKQWIIGHEIVEAPEEVEVKPEVKPQRGVKEYDIPWAKIAATALAIAVGAVAVIGYGMLMAFSMVDPRLIAVLDDEEGTWVSVCEWEE
jgi:hypothetical protein